MINILLRNFLTFPLECGMQYAAGKFSLAKNLGAKSLYKEVLMKLNYHKMGQITLHQELTRHIISDVLQITSNFKNSIICNRISGTLWGQYLVSWIATLLWTAYASCVTWRWMFATELDASLSMRQQKKVNINLDLYNTNFTTDISKEKQLEHDCVYDSHSTTIFLNKKYFNFREGKYSTSISLN